MGIGAAPGGGQCLYCVDWPKEPSAQWDVFGKSQGQVFRLLTTALAESFVTGFLTQSHPFEVPQTPEGGRNEANTTQVGSTTTTLQLF